MADIEPDTEGRLKIHTTECPVDCETDSGAAITMVPTVMLDGEDLTDDHISVCSLMGYWSEPLSQR